MPSASLAYGAASAAAAVAVYHFCIIARPRSKRAAANKRVQGIKSRTPNAQLKNECRESSLESFDRDSADRARGPRAAACLLV